VAVETEERVAAAAEGGRERPRPPLERVDPFEAAVARVEEEERITSRVGVVAGIQLAIGALGLLLGALGFVALSGVGWVSQDPSVQTWMSGLGGVVASFFGLLSIPTLAAGFGLLRRRPWARVLGMVLGAIELFQVPVGTVLGGYSLFVLSQKSTRDYFERPLRR
jgi:hypothetical protein